MARSAKAGAAIAAAGTAGFGRELAGVVALDRLGGLVTKSVSPEPRAGHPAADEISPIR